MDTVGEHFGDYSSAEEQTGEPVQRSLSVIPEDSKEGLLTPEESTTRLAPAPPRKCGTGPPENAAKRALDRKARQGGVESGVTQTKAARTHCRGAPCPTGPSPSKSAGNGPAMVRGAQQWMRVYGL